MRRLKYIYERSGWPNFTWQDDVLAADLADLRHKQGRLVGRMESRGFALREESVLRSLTEEVVKSSDIEGERLDTNQVRSSIARHLGMDIAGLVPADRDVDGVVEMLLDATGRYEEPLTADRLFAWHSSLFPAARSGMRKISIGKWRDDKSGPIQVVSGPVGREAVHFEAPPTKAVAKEMRAFLKWFEGAKQIDAVLAAGIAHLWFVTIHPFDDGNGRIARAITDLALARSEGTSQRFYSMSSQIRAERDSYYNILESTQKGDMDITTWLQWFITCLNGALSRSEKTLSAVLAKSRFWDSLKDTSLNERQQLMLNKLVDGFEGNLTSSKWAKITKTSQDTAIRDIDDLVAKRILARGPAGGRSTSYEIVGLDRPK